MDYHFAHGEFLSRRALALGGIGAFHVLIAYLLLNSLIAPVLKIPEKPTIGFVLPPDPAPPVQVQPDYHPDPLAGPIVAPRVEPLAPVQDPPPAGIAATSIESSAGAGVAVAATALPLRLIGRNQLPDTEDYYPPDLRRLGVQGATNVRVCVDEQGNRQAEPVVEASSGNPRLDSGAVNVARHGRYARTMQGDRAVGNCYRFRILFRIK
jgi:TonB family protein